MKAILAAVLICVGLALAACASGRGELILWPDPAQAGCNEKGKPTCH